MRLVVPVVAPLAQDCSLQWVGLVEVKRVFNYRPVNITI